MMSCNSYLPNGGSGKICELGEVKGLMLFDPSITFASEAAVDNKETLRGYLQETLKLAVFDVRGAEVTNSEWTTEETGTGNTIFGELTSGGAVFSISTTGCDHAEAVKMLNGNYRAMLLLSGGVVSGTKDDGQYRGYEVLVKAYPVSVPTREKANMFRVHITFQNSTEVLNPFYREVGYTLNTLRGYTPAALNMSVTKISGTSFTATVTERCTNEPYVSATLDIKTFGGGNVLSPDYTVTNNTDGTYTVVATKNSTPISFEAGDYDNIRAEDKTSAVYDYLSSVEKVEV